MRGRYPPEEGFEIQRRLLAPGRGVGFVEEALALAVQLLEAPFGLSRCPPEVAAAAPCASSLRGGRSHGSGTADFYRLCVSPGGYWKRFGEMKVEVQLQNLLFFPI